MPSLTPRHTYHEARLVLPARFADSAVLAEEVSETQLRIHTAATTAGDEVPFTEEQRPLLADEDRDFLLSLLAAPPKANPALKKAAEEYSRLCG